MTTAVKVQPEVTTQTGAPEPPKERFVALDAARGFVMLVLASEGFGIHLLAGSHAGEPLHGLLRQFDHLRWDGLVIWDMIMPSFQFIVGAALPFALARRQGQNQPFGQMLRHVIWRCGWLIIIGQLLWYGFEGPGKVFDPYETLTQIALGYFICFLVLHHRREWQVAVAAGLMALNWVPYVLFPGPAGPFSPTGNIGIRIDQALFHLDHNYDWQTMNFLGSAVTMIFGAWTAQWITSNRPTVKKLKRLLVAAAIGLAIGLAIRPINPIIHKCWTASFTFVHTGLILLWISSFVWLFDLRGYRKLAFPLVVMGMNSIFIYTTFLSVGEHFFEPYLNLFLNNFWFMGSLALVGDALADFAILWYLCYWLYNRRIFFKL